MYPITILLYVVSLLLPQIALAARPPSQLPVEQTPENYSSSTLNALKVPGESPAYYCADPSHDIFQIRRFDFTPTNVRIGYYLTTRFIGTFTSSTGDFPWLNITGSINGRRELEPLYNSLLCDIDVFQEFSVPRPGGDDELNGEPRMHRACPPNIEKGYAVVSSPPMPLTPQTVPQGKYNLRAEAMTQDGKRIFCVEGSFDVTT